MAFEQIIEAIETAVMKAAFDIEAHAVRIVPVDTGRLKGSLRTKASKNTINISANTEYAEFVEFGTIFQRAQPYITPAIHMGVKKFIPERIKQELKRLR